MNSRSNQKTKWREGLDPTQLPPTAPQIRMPKQKVIRPIFDTNCLLCIVPGNCCTYYCTRDNEYNWLLFGVHAQSWPWHDPFSSNPSIRNHALDNVHSDLCLRTPPQMLFPWSGQYETIWFSLFFSSEQILPPRDTTTGPAHGACKYQSLLPHHRYTAAVVVGCVFGWQSEIP